MAACEEISAVWGSIKKPPGSAAGSAERGCAVIPETLAGWTLEALRGLLERGIFEDRRLEFKEMLPNGKDRDARRRLRGTVSAFANSDGGFR